MKKKAIKIAASTAVAASAFVAAAPAQQADAAVNVNQVVTDAQNAGTVLKWAISVEGSADFVSQPYAQYNAAKAAIKAAEAAAAKLSVSEKLAVDAKLVDAKIQVTRAGYYIDAITSSNKIKELTATLDAAIASGDIAKVEAAYHKATAEYRKQAKLLDRVYGQTTRDEIRNAVKPALEKSVASVKNEVTVSMLVAAADADVKAGKIAEAHAKIAEAQAILDANVLKWETALQKSVTDAKTALPAIPGNITVEGAAFHGEVGQTYAVAANLKSKNGATYNGPVKLSFSKAKNAAGTSIDGDLAYEFVTVNGVPYSQVTNDTVYPINGQLVVTVRAQSGVGPVAGGKVNFVTYPDGTTNAKGEDTQSGTLNFYNLVETNGTADVLDTTTGKVKFVDAANNYFVTTNLNKYVVKAGNVYQDTNNALLTPDAFKAKLKAGDVVTGYYHTGVGSTLKLALSYLKGGEFAVNQFDQLETDVYRVEGNTVTLSGTGDAGKVVSIYNHANIGSTPVVQVQVGSNGLWSAVVNVPGQTDLAARQSTSVNEITPVYATNLDGLSKVLTVVPGKFTAQVTGGITVAQGDTLTGSTPYTFTAGLAADGDAVVASNASITLVDGSMLSATYVNGVGGTVIESDPAGFKVTFGTPTKTSQVGKALTGKLSVTGVTGITNAYGFKAVVK